MSSGWPSISYDPPPRGDKRVVLITGFRDWDDEASVEYVMNFLHPNVLIHGGASGVDWIADRWARRKGGIDIEPHKIPKGWWDSFGKRAGPMRNEHMLRRIQDWETMGHSVLVVAFPQPESTGTIDMIEQAVRANLPVLVYQ